MSIIELFLECIITILICVIFELFKALIIWGLANLIIWVFGIPFAMTFLKALIIDLIIKLIKIVL